MFEHPSIEAQIRAYCVFQHRKVPKRTLTTRTSGKSVLVFVVIKSAVSGALLRCVWPCRFGPH